MSGRSNSSRKNQPFFMILWLVYVSIPIRNNLTRTNSTTCVARLLVNKPFSRHHHVLLSPATTRMSSNGSSFSSAKSSAWCWRKQQENDNVLLIILSKYLIVTLNNYWWGLMLISMSVEWREEFSAVYMRIHENRIVFIFYRKVE